MELKQVVHIWTDGACKGNPGSGGWGALLRHEGEEFELFGGESPTTNNRMEMTAVIRSLNALAHSCQVHLFSDSRYVLDGITQWVNGWEKNGWKTKDRQDVKNADLWKAMIEAVSRHEIEWQWVKGHSDHPENERADWLANQGVLMDSSALEFSTDRRLFLLPDEAGATPCVN